MTMVGTMMTMLIDVDGDGGTSGDGDGGDDGDDGDDGACDDDDAAGDYLGIWLNVL